MIWVCKGPMIVELDLNIRTQVIINECGICHQQVKKIKFKMHIVANKVFVVAG